MVLTKFKQKSLFRLFLKQLLTFAFLVLLEIIIFLLTFAIGLYSGKLLPANHSEQVLKNNEEALIESTPLDTSLIPFTCTYGLFDLEKNYVSGNFNDTTRQKAKSYIDNTATYGEHFFLVKRADGYCIIQYDVTAHFASPTLHRICPSPELTFAIIFIVIFLLILILSASRFGKRLNSELKPLIEEVTQINNRDLDIKPNHSSIKEFNDILNSLNDMKVALATSLQNEWITEQNRKSHISALAHDIRTPLTVMKGNAELIIEDTDLTCIHEAASLINSNADKIDRYLIRLIDATKEAYTATDIKTPLELSSLLTNIVNEVNTLCKSTNTDLVITNSITTNQTIHADKDFITRGVLNLIRNSIEHCSHNCEIHLTLTYTDGILGIKVEDNGSGFSPEALKNATKQFYTDRTERGDEHYGLGLYIVSMIAKSYQGSLVYKNKEDSSGAVVLLTLTLTNSPL